MAAGPENREDTDDEWRFSLEEIESIQANDEQTAGEQGGNVAGSLIQREPLEAGDIDLENAVFVALGVLFVLGLLAATFLGI
jgi:hypothetical protein